MSQLSVSFIVVTYQNQETIFSCLDSIRSWTSDSYEIVVVDNSPGDETFEEVERFRATHPEVSVTAVRPSQNVGFGRGCNMGAKRAEGDYLFFLNPDTQLLNDTGRVLRQCLESQPGAIAAGPSVCDERGHLTRTCRNLPTPFRIILDACGLDRWLGFYKLPIAKHVIPGQVEQIIGAAIFMRRLDFQRLGGMDERFFVYFEEVDLCKRLLESGGTIWYWPDARVQHLAGHSCEVGSSKARMVFILRESRKKYFVKHFGLYGAFMIELINRIEALQKLAALCFLSVIRRKSGDRAKFAGFWAIATGRVPGEWRSHVSSHSVHRKTA